MKTDVDINPHEHSVVGSLLIPVARVLQARGIEPIELMELAGIDPSKIANPDWRVSIVNWNKLMRLCVDATNDEAVGLYAAEKLQPQVLHALGLGWLASDTIYDGLRRLVRFCKLISSLSELDLDETEGYVKLRIHGGVNHVLDNFEYAGRDYGVGMVVRMCQLNLGDFLSPVKIELDRPEPNDPSLWEYMLASKVSFDCEETSIFWSRSDIDHKLVTGDPALARIVDEHAASYVESLMVSSFSRRVAEKIISRLPDGPPNQNLIALDMCVSNRTLQRKLKDEGCSFSDLLSDSRKLLAKKYLRQPSRSIVEISYLLGFSEPSAFSRAFKGWTKETPAHYRSRNS